jgi:hypothetical protein
MEKRILIINRRVNMEWISIGINVVTLIVITIYMVKIKILLKKIELTQKCLVRF